MFQFSESFSKFLKLCGGLKSEPRRGWLSKADVKRPESVADHTFRTVLISMLIGDLKGLDSCRMMKMALLHDLPEALIGDLMPQDRPKIEEEDSAMKNILEYLNIDLKSKYLEVWREWLNGSSEEAKLVREIDKLEMALQASEYLEVGYEKDVLNEFIESASKAIEDKLLRSLLHQIHATK